MSYIEVVFLAIALSIDASVVSFSQGLCFRENKRKNSLFLAASVGIFQALMPIIGWFLARSVYKYIEAVDHWIAFGIFLFLGLKFIKDAIQAEKKEKCDRNNISLKHLLLIAVATSIDALAAGATLYFVKINIFIPAIIIGIITFLNSLIGFWSGIILKKFPSKYLEIFAGIILIALGIKALMG